MLLTKKGALPNLLLPSQLPPPLILKFQAARFHALALLTLCSLAAQATASTSPVRIFMISLEEQFVSLAPPFYPYLALLCAFF
jgi:hypothetical protein